MVTDPHFTDLKNALQSSNKMFKIQIPNHITQDSILLDSLCRIMSSKVYFKTSPTF
uniref:Uncharacterized protein n=1 Tax=Anguilla anguilla TaxID=7936 RepID=A0A0E9TJK3_ANGAN